MKKAMILLGWVLTLSIALQGQNNWLLGPFVKTKLNPILKADSTLTFLDPVKKEIIKWQKADVFNPAAIVKNGKKRHKRKCRQ